MIPSLCFIGYKNLNPTDKLEIPVLILRPEGSRSVTPAK